MSGKRQSDGVLQPGHGDHTKCSDVPSLCRGHPDLRALQQQESRDSHIRDTHTRQLFHTHYKLSGHAIPHTEVDAWLSSWGGENELPCPK